MRKRAARGQRLLDFEGGSFFTAVQNVRIPFMTDATKLCVGIGMSSRIEATDIAGRTM
jgi:hypothetical protein